MFIEKWRNRKGSTPAGVAGLRGLRGFYKHMTPPRSRVFAFCKQMEDCNTKVQFCIKHTRFFVSWHIFNRKELPQLTFPNRGVSFYSVKQSRRDCMFIEKWCNRKGSTPAGVAGLRGLCCFYKYTTSLRSVFWYVANKGKIKTQKNRFALISTGLNIIHGVCVHNLNRNEFLNSLYFQITPSHQIFGQTIPAGLHVYRKMT